MEDNECLHVNIASMLQPVEFGQPLQSCCQSSDKLSDFTLKMRYWTAMNA